MTRSACLAAAMFVTVCLAVPAVAQESLAKFLGYRALFTEDDVSSLDRAVELTAEQRLRASEIMLKAVRECFVGYGRLNERLTVIYAESTAEQRADKQWQLDVRKRHTSEYCKACEECARIERTALGELQGLLTPEQVQRVGTEQELLGWAAFERERRIGLTINEALGSTHPLMIVEAVRLDDADVAAIAPVIERYKSALDPMARSFMVKGASRFEEHCKGSFEDLHTQQVYESVEFQKLTIKTFRELTEAVSPAGADLLWRQRLSSYAGLYSGTVLDTGAFDVALKVSGLTDTQRTAIGNVKVAIEAEIVQELIAAVSAMDRDSERADWSPETTNFDYEIHHKRYLKWQSRTKDELRTLLSAEQTKEFEAAMYLRTFGAETLTRRVDRTVASPLVPKERRRSPEE